MASLNSAGGGGAKLESEVAVALDLNVIRYSKVWEDHRVLSQALDIQPGDVVLSITRWLASSSLIYLRPFSGY